MIISKRLKTVASFVKKDANILDCGCDHAYLPIFLIENKIVSTAYASDINEGPLLYAKKNIEKYNMQNKIYIYQADGLDKMPSSINTIIISGMGTSTIIDILKKGNLTNIENLIISSNNDHYELRKFIISLNYKIEDEEIVLDKNKFYPIIKFSKGNQLYNYLELKYGPILIKNKNKTFIDYLNNIRQNDEKIIKNNKTLYNIKKEINEIKSLI